MSASYSIDPNGVVHVMNPETGAEFTFCSVNTDSDDAGGFYRQDHAGPATCRKCRDAVDRIKASLVDVVWILRRNA